MTIPMQKIFTVGCLLFVLFFCSNLYAADETVKYSYDDLDRLTGVEYVGAGSIHFRYDKGGDITNLTILVANSTIVDTDQDGIADEWEIFYFGNLTSASATTDGEHDGYSDIWEYLNWKEGLLDNNGGTFDPLITNAPNGRGYSTALNSGKFWLMMMPAILRNAGK